MWVLLGILLLGFVLLILSADKFVAGAAATAQNYGVSKLLIGLTVVSIGTSAPEILVALVASLEGAPEAAIGNAIGSNIANIGLVLGVTAIVLPLPFATSVLKSEMPWLLLATLLTALCLINLELTRLDGVLLVILLTAGLYRMLRTARKSRVLTQELEEEMGELPQMQRGKALAWMFASLIVLLLSAQMVVFAAVSLAHNLGVSEMVIGLTVLAVGTSLPELAATVTAAVKGHPEIAIGNVVGSNILNILAVLAVPALIHPTTISLVEYWRDFGVMFAFTALLALFAYGIRSQKIITRFEGSVLLIAWVGYIFMLYNHSM